MAQLVLNQNQFAQTPILGQAASVENPAVFPVRLNPSSTAVLQAGSAVKLIAGTSNEYLVDATTGPTDGPVFGIIAYNMRKNLYAAGDSAEVFGEGSVVFLESSAAITRGAKVASTAATSGNDPTVATAVNSTDYITGYALDSAAGAGALIRVMVKRDAPGLLVA